jgi:hypothetical protein
MAKKKKADAEALATKVDPRTAATLYVNERGLIECGSHAPREDTQTWTFDGWREMTTKDIKALGAVFDPKRACAKCAHEQEGEAAKSTPPAKEPPKKKNLVAIPTLLWNERGQTGCTLPGHAPHKGSDTWRFEHWKKIPEGTLNEDGQPFACEVCKAGERTSGNAAATKDEPAPAPAVGEPTTEPKPADEKPAPKKGKRAKGEITLADLAEKYLAHMERAGKANGTIFSYKLELATALDALGAETKLADLTPHAVLAYFGSARVNKKKTGKAKSPLSIAKTQRVLRLALVWAEGAKLIEKAPLPEDAATH